MYGFNPLIIIIPCKNLNSCIRPIDGTLTGTTTLGQSGTESNDNDWGTPYFLNLKTGASLSDAV